MKLEMYEPGEVGYVVYDPYDWKYNGRYNEIIHLLENGRPTFHQGVAAGDADGEVEITDPKDWMLRLERELKIRGVWHVNIIE